MGRRAGYRQEDVLKAAVTLFRANGFHRVSIEDVVEVTNVNRFALYEKFGGKEGLFYAAIEYYHRTIIRKELLGPLHAGDAGLDALLTMLHTLEAINRDTRMSRGCLIVNANIELGGADERVAGEAAFVMASFRHAVTNALTSAERRGELNHAQSIPERVGYLTVMILALFSLAYLSREVADELIGRVVVEVEGWRGAPAARGVAPVLATRE